MAKSSTNSEKHPYLRFTFWKNNKFWNRPDVPQHVKDYYNEWLESWEEKEKSLTNLGS